MSKMIMMKTRMIGVDGDGDEDDEDGENDEDGVEVHGEKNFYSKTSNSL